MARHNISGRPQPGMDFDKWAAQAYEKYKAARQAQLSIRVNEEWATQWYEAARQAQLSFHVHIEETQQKDQWVVVLAVSNTTDFQDHDHPSKNEYKDKGTSKQLMQQLV